MDEPDNTYPSEEIIEAYLTGLLPAKERAVLEQRMAADPDIRERVALHRKLIHALRFARKQVLKEQFRANFDNRAIPGTDNQRPAVKPVFWNGNIRWALAIAILALFSLIAFLTGKKIGQNQAKQPPAYIRDTVFIEAPEIVPPEKKREQNNTVTTNRNQIAALHRSPSVDIFRSTGKVPDTDTLSRIRNLWEDNRFVELTQLAVQYEQRQELPVELATLYAAAQFKLGNYGAAELIYSRLAEVISVKKEAQWNLLVCYALQMPDKRDNFNSLAGEIDKWGKPNPYEQDLARLRSWLNR